MAKSKDIEAVPWEAVHWEANNLMGGLSILRERAELQALDAIGWYYSKKKSKNFWSRWLRFWAILYTILGGLAPILSATGLAQLIAQYFYGNVDDRDLRLAEMRFNQCGYVLIGLAAGCLAFDRFFGFSTNWMRYIGAAMRIETARVRFRFEWERLAAPLKGSEPDKDGLEDFLEAIERFSLAIREAVEQETGAWISEFQTNLSQLDRETKALFESAHNEKKAVEQKARARKRNPD